MNDPGKNRSYVKVSLYDLMLPMCYHMERSKKSCNLMRCNAL
jgi:hypothetical protein